MMLCNIIYIIYIRGNMKCPKKHVKDVFFTWGHMHIFLKCPKIEQFYFRLIFCFKIDHVLISWNALIFYVRIFWNAPFFLSDSENGAFHITPGNLYFQGKKSLYFRRLDTIKWIKSKWWAQILNLLPLQSQLLEKAIRIRYVAGIGQITTNANYYEC